MLVSVEESENVVFGVQLGLREIISHFTIEGFRITFPQLVLAATSVVPSTHHKQLEAGVARGRSGFFFGGGGGDQHGSSCRASNCLFSSHNRACFVGIE